MRSHNKDMGFLGERFAGEYLKKKGYSVLERNYRTKSGEIDLIACCGKIVSFIEVKTRTGTEFGSPQDAVDQSKQKKIAKTALYYLKAKGLLGYDCRFDVISILIGPDNCPERIEFIENAFIPADYYTF